MMSETPASAPSRPRQSASPASSSRLAAAKGSRPGLPVAHGDHQAAVDVALGEEPVGRQPGLAVVSRNGRLPLAGVGRRESQRRQPRVAGDLVAQPPDRLERRRRQVGVARDHIFENLGDAHAHAVVGEGVAAVGAERGRAHAAVIAHRRRISFLEPDAASLPSIAVLKSRRVAADGGSRCRIGGPGACCFRSWRWPSPSAPARAGEDVTVPARVQAQLLVAVASFQSNMNLAADGSVQILVLTKDDDAGSERVARQLIGALGDMKKIARHPHHELVEPFHDAATLADDLPRAPHRDRLPISRPERRDPRRRAGAAGKRGADRWRGRQLRPARRGAGIRSGVGALGDAAQPHADEIVERSVPAHAVSTDEDRRVTRRLRVARRLASLLFAASLVSSAPAFAQPQIDGGAPTDAAATDTTVAEPAPVPAVAQPASPPPAAADAPPAAPALRRPRLCPRKTSPSCAAWSRSRSCRPPRSRWSRRAPRPRRRHRSPPTTCAASASVRSTRRSTTSRSACSRRTRCTRSTSARVACC